MIKHLPLAVFCVGLAVLTASFGAALFGPSLEEAPSRAAQTNHAAPANAGTHSGLNSGLNSSLDLAASKALFGVTAQAPAPKAAAPNLPQLELTGVLAAANPEDSQAMIQTEDGIRIFRLGDVVAASLALTEIRKDSVTISDGASDHVLSFDIASVHAPAGQAAAPDPGPYQTAAHRAISAKLKAPETTAEYIEYWRERIRRNPGEVLSEIGLVPTDRGYAISEDQDIGVRLAGFRTGDLITEVNGVAVGNADRDRKRIDAILAEGLAQITFERNGEARVLTFPLR